ncbi:sensor histidine kinase N-terminal domain-containing protein [bacterium]|nr:sensor histidine kinase N-terminal domain-containing protein [bacterium]
MRSLATRIGILILALLLPLLAIFGLSAFKISEHELTASFDASLRANAEALATLVEVEDDGWIELEFADEIMTRFSRGSEPDLFAVYDSSGLLIEKSRSSTQPLPENLEEFLSAANDFEYGGDSYRGIAVDAFAENEEGDRDASTMVRLFFASTRRPLDEALTRLASRIASTLLALGVLCSLLAAFIARKSLKPLRDFARRLDRVSPRDLNEHFEVEEVPTELRRPAASFNRLIARLKEAFDRERNFSADAAHELRTPVGAMLVEIQAARLSPRDAKADDELLRDLEEETNRLHALCEGLLTLHARPADEPQAMSLNDWKDSVQSTCDAMQTLTKSAGTRLEFRCSAKSPSLDLLRTSPEITQRIVTNLISNALAHGGPPKTIEVQAQVIDGRLELAVDDDGNGISEELAHRVFERLVRGDSSRSRRAGGAGLGLTICRELAQRCGGDVEYRRKDSTGACFVWIIAPAKTG